MARRVSIYARTSVSSRIALEEVTTFHAALKACVKLGIDRSFLLYLFGYLALRFQLSTYGVATNLDVFDEKYLLAGCRFLVYFVAAVPNILIIVLVLAAVGYLPYKLVPATFKGCLTHWASGWCARPAHLPLLGVVFGTILVQFVLRKCLAFGNLLFAKQLPDRWLSSILLASDEEQSLYFSGLVAGTLLTAGILLYVLRCGTASTPSAS